MDEGFIDAICGTKLEGADSIAKSHQDSSNESVWKEVLLIQLMLVKEGVKTPKEVVELLASQLVPRDTKVPSHVKG